MLKTAKSRLSEQFNDPSINKRRHELKMFKREHGLHDFRQIDKQNLDMFLRLAQVQPHVPVVIKRNVMEAGM